MVLTLSIFAPWGLLKQLLVTYMLRSNALLILYYVFTLRSCWRALFDQHAGATPHYYTDGLHLLHICFKVVSFSKTSLDFFDQCKHKKNCNCGDRVSSNQKCTRQTWTSVQLLMFEMVCWSDLKLDLGWISIHQQCLSAYLAMTPICRLQILVCRVELLQPRVL